MQSASRFGGCCNVRELQSQGWTEGALRCYRGYGSTVNIMGRRARSVLYRDSFMNPTKVSMRDPCPFGSHLTVAHMISVFNVRTGLVKPSRLVRAKVLQFEPPNPA